MKIEVPAFDTEDLDPTPKVRHTVIEDIPAARVENWEWLRTYIERRWGNSSEIEVSWGVLDSDGNSFLRIHGPFKETDFQVKARRHMTKQALKRAIEQARLLREYLETEEGQRVSAELALEALASKDKPLITEALP